MTDDLVKRLRAYEGKGFETTACYNGTRSEAADRIEELEGQLKALVDALYKSAEGWDNVIGMGLIAKKHFGSARVLRDEALEALQRVGV